MTDAKDVRAVLVYVDCVRCKGEGWVPDREASVNSPGALMPCPLCSGRKVQVSSCSVDALRELLR